MARTRVDHHERTTRVIDDYPTGRRDPRQSVIDRALKRSAVGDQIDRIIEDMRCGLGDVLAVLLPALTHDIEEEDATLPGIHQIFESGCKDAG